MDFFLLFKYVFIFLALIAIALIVYVAVGSRKGRKISDAERKKIHIAWKKIEGYAKGDGERVFTDGDKLVDHVLKLYGYEGSMAEKLKSSKALFGPVYQDMWWVHKMRNRIAHEIGVEVSGREANRALRILKSVLSRLKAL